MITQETSLCPLFPYPSLYDQSLNQNLSLIECDFGTSLECTHVLPLHSDDLFPVMAWMSETAS